MPITVAHSCLVNTSPIKREQCNVDKREACPPFRLFMNQSATANILLLCLSFILFVLL